MRATHTDYLHPRHLRVEMDGDVFCVAPSSSLYGRLNKASLPRFGINDGDFDLPRHSSSWSIEQERSG